MTTNVIRQAFPLTSLCFREPVSISTVATEGLQRNLILFKFYSERLLSTCILIPILRNWTCCNDFHIQRFFCFEDELKFMFSCEVQDFLWCFGSANDLWVLTCVSGSSIYKPLWSLTRADCTWCYRFKAICTEIPVAPSILNYYKWLLNYVWLEFKCEWSMTWSRNQC